jgi:hypothetical protein
MMHYWLLDQTIDTMAMFIICHERDMERARISEMYRRNAQLEAQVAAMRARGVQPDPTWYPPNQDPDLFHNDNYVNATYNPRPKEVTEYTYHESGGGPTWSGFFGFIWWCIKWIFFIGLFILVCWLIFRGVSYVLFERRYGP